MSIKEDIKVQWVKTKATAKARASVQLAESKVIAQQISRKALARAKEEAQHAREALARLEAKSQDYFAESEANQKLGYHEEQEAAAEQAPKHGWQSCSFREIHAGDWVRFSPTGTEDAIRYGIAHTFTDKNWWLTESGHLLVGPAAIPSGRGQMTTGTLVFPPKMTLERIPAQREEKNRPTVVQRFLARFRR